MGRCGEHQDMAAAAGRAGLIPTTCTLNMAEDHVWNEFWDGRWIHWDANSKKNVDCEFSHDKDYNGGKDISTVWNYRGDSMTWSVTDRYTPTCTYTATVLDNAGKPVDGAEVWVVTENYYNQNEFTITTWGSTDYTGTVTFKLGNARNYWSCADTDNLGEDPPDQGGEERIAQIITNSGTGSYTHTFNLPGTLPQLSASADVLPINPLNKYKMEVSYRVESNILHGKNVLTGDHYDYQNPDGNIDFFIADTNNYNDYANKMAFDAFKIGKGGSSGEISFTLPSGDDWYAVFSNEFSQKSCKIVNVTVKIYGYLITEITSPDENAELNLDSIVEIKGTAFSPLAVSGVEIDIDNRDIWETATDTTVGANASWSTWKYDWDTKGLKPGVHTVRVRVSDTNNIYITTRDFILIDVSKPEVTFKQPLNNSKFNIGEAVSITGTAVDNVAVLTIELIIDDDLEKITDITSSLSEGNWAYTINTDKFDDGIHTLEIRAFDQRYNNESSIIYIILEETINPVVSITAPANNSIFEPGDRINFKGFASDNIAITSLSLIIDDNEVNITSKLKGDHTWNHMFDTSKSPLEEGLHIVELLAFDARQNSGSTRINLYIDGTKPEVIITTPSPNRIFSAGDEILVEGTASDNIGVKTLLFIFNKEKPVNITSNLIDGQWSYTLTNTDNLRTGEHRISIRAVDISGFDEEVKVLVIIDAEDPVVDIPEIADNFFIGKILRLEGTASDDVEVVSLELIIDDNEPVNITSVYSPGFWTLNFNTSDLTEGRQNITVRVTDIVGKVATDKISVRFITDTTDLDNDGMPDWWELQFPPAGLVGIAISAFEPRYKGRRNGF
jgi:hypothetical protein